MDDSSPTRVERAVAPIQFPEARLIADLKPELEKEWSVVARVVSKEPVRKVGKQMMFWCTLLDGSGAISATFVNMKASFDKLEDGKIYTFARGQIKTAKERNTTVSHENCVSFDAPAAKTFTSENDEAAAAAIPAYNYHIVPISTLAEASNHKRVDVLVVVKKVPDTHQTTAQGKNFRTLVVADDSGRTDLTLWDDDAVECPMQEGEGYILKDTRVNKFTGGRSTRIVSWDLKAGLVVIPEDDEDLQEKLRVIRKSLRKGRDADLPNISAIPKVVRGHFNELKPLEKNPSGPSERIMEVLCVPPVSAVQAARKGRDLQDGDLWFPTCSVCTKGIKWVAGPEEDPDNGAWSCVNCSKGKGKKPIVMKEQYKLKLQICDGKAFKIVTVFDAVGNSLFGMSAAQLNKIIYTDEEGNFFETATSCFIQKPCILLLKVKFEGAAVKDMTAIKITVCSATGEDLPQGKEDVAEYEEILEFMKKPKEVKPQKSIKKEEGEADGTAEATEEVNASRGKRDRGDDDEEDE